MPKKAKYIKDSALKKVWPRSKKMCPEKPSRKLPEVEFNEESGYTKTESIYSDRAYKFYMNRSKDGKRLTKHALFRTFKYVLREIRRRMVHSEAGVFIENFGYFFVARRPFRSFYMGINRINKMGQSFMPMFLPIRKDTALNMWTMDRGFLHSLRERINDKANAGKRYKMVYSVLKNLYGRKGTSVTLPKKRERDNN